MTAGHGRQRSPAQPRRRKNQRSRPQENFFRSLRPPPPTEAALNLHFSQTILPPTVPSTAKAEAAAKIHQQHSRRRLPLPATSARFRSQHPAPAYPAPGKPREGQTRADGRGFFRCPTPLLQRLAVDLGIPTSWVCACARAMAAHRT